ncbi:hypothetical protein HA402_004851 [Bradysia odoriphaga]|nr:hypothetical protein HA402_004851 [Bradysia odoriphaga]
MTVKSSSQNEQVLKVERRYYEQEQLNTELSYSKPENNESFKTMLCSNIQPKKFFLKTFPIFVWLSQYSMKEDLFGDVIAGCTVAVMHIPQSLGYATLAKVPPVLGIYTAYIPVIMYCIFGTSRHNSMGTFAVVTIMIGKEVSTHDSYDPVVVATTLCFIVGTIQLAMYILRLGIISSLLSETLVSGFTTGAALHVLVSQLKDLLGIELKKENAIFQNVYAVVELFQKLFERKYNGLAVIISTITILLIVFNNEILKPILAKRCRIPVPIELIVVVGGTLMATYTSIIHDYKIRAIGEIPTGFPNITMPSTDLMSDLLIGGFTISMVSYTVSVSMALIFAKKMSYEVDFNQELLAMGSANVVGSFLSCFPVSASLSRTTIQQAVGGRTQVASLISCAILTLVLLWWGPFFECLPKCVLSSIIVVALKGMLLQTKDFIKFYKLSHLDAVVWIGTFIVVVFIAIDIGLAVGIVLSVSCIFIRGSKPYTCLLGKIPKTDFYLDIERYKVAEEIPGIKIYHYCGSLNFASRNAFKKNLCEQIGVDLALEKKRMLKSENYEPIYLKCLILDFSALSYIDPSGVTSLILLVKEFNKLQILVFISGCSCPVYEVMKKCGLKESADGYFKFFPTVSDAVHHAQEAFVQISVITSL